jgi:hypothetical protein
MSRATLVLLLVLTGPTALAQQIVVGPNVLVSKGEQAFKLGETLLTADPKDPNRLLGCAMIWLDGARRRTTIVYASFDGGKSWEPTLDTKKFFDSSDPAIAFGLDNTAYYTVLATPEAESTSRLRMLSYRSNDGGRTWLPPLAISPFASIDREFIVVDNTAGQYRGRVYIAGVGTTRSLDDSQTISHLTLYSSQDGGSSYLGPVQRASPSDKWIFPSGNNVVLSDGTFVTLFGEVKDLDKAKKSITQRFGLSDFPDSFDAELKVLMSKDGGRSLSTEVTVGGFHVPISPFTGHIPYLAVDPSNGIFKDRLYVVWPDISSGRSQIMLAYSRDKGNTWSEARVINDDHAAANPAGGPDHFLPVVAVNKSGVVGVMWYDRRNNPENLGWHVRFSASLDGGETWLPSVPVSTASAVYGKDEKLFTKARSTTGRILKLVVDLDDRQFGAADTAGMAADADGAFHPFWIDNRTGTPQVWTAGVVVKGVASKNGSPDLASLDDITDKVTMEMNEASYDRTSDLVKVNVQLKNKSSAVLEGPIKLRVLKLQSALGIVEIVNSDNGLKEDGAVWDFSAQLKERVLRPNEFSGTKTLIFRLTKPKPFREGNKFNYGLVGIDARILGRLR